MMKVILTPSPREGKKWRIEVPRIHSSESMSIDIGEKGMEDFTTHRDAKRKKNYLRRHAPRETWTKNGIRSAGFWARWLLWNQPSLTQSIRDVEQRFDVDIVRRQ